MTPSTSHRRGLRSSVFAVSLLCACITASAQFSPAKVIGLSTMAGGIQASGDIDGDGDTDLLAVGGRNVVLFVNDGQGSFTIVELLLDGEYQGWEIAAFMLDVDSDGALDVIVQDGPPSGSNQDGSILWTRNLGNSVFAPPVVIPDISINGKLLGFEDIDSDGDEDMLIHIPPGYLWYKENLGNGAFGPEVSLATMMDAVRTIDLDGDEHLDLIQETAFNDQMTIHRGNGDGTFTITMTAPSEYGQSVQDVNGDGFDDLVETTPAFAWRRGHGDGTFDALAPFGVVPLHNGIGFVDINGDGAQDLITMDYLELKGALNLGDYTFGPLYDLFTPLQGGNDNYGGFYFCDADGDGGNEMFLGLSEVIRQCRFPQDGTMELGSIITDHIYPTFSFMGAMDLNSDGALDILHGDERIKCVKGYARQSSGAFDQFQPLAEYGIYTGRDVEAIADMDNDGDQDLVLVADEVEVMANDGTGAFTLVASEVVPNLESDSKVTARDLDGDGDQDLFVCHQSRIRVLRNDGGNNFTLLATSGTLQMSDPVILGFLDVDNDGDEDMITQRFPIQVTTTEWLRNDGALVFGARTAITGISEETPVMDIVDADLDGDLDLFSYLDQGSYVFLTRNQGNGTFSATTTVMDDALLGVCWPRVFDADGDGDGDIVVPMETTGGSLLLNDGTGSFSAPQPLTGVDIGFDDDNRDYWKPIDMDADGDLDIVYFTSDGMWAERTGLAWSENFFADPYHLYGSVYADMDGDGIFDVGEPGLPGATMHADPAGYFTTGNSTGEYLLYSSAGSQTVSAAPPGPLWSQSSTPLTYSVQPSTAQPDWPGLDFGFEPVVDTSIVHPELVLASAPCSDQTSLWLTYMNEGTRIEHGTIELVLDAAFGYISSSPAPTTIVSNTLTWSFADLGFFETGIIQLVVTMPDAGSIGDPFQHAATVTTLDDLGDASESFAISLNGIISCAYDPNDKLVDPIGYGTMGAVPLDTDELEYTIRFQNTGNAPAENVMLRDQLDGHLIASSLRVLGYSHVPNEVVIEPGNELVVRFNNIQLPDSGTSFTESQGFFKFRMAIEPGLPHLTQIVNTAEIYFDLNAPVFTNTAHTTLVDCALWQPVIDVLPSSVLEATAGDAYQWLLNGQLIVGANEQWFMPGIGGMYSVLVTSAYGCEATTAGFTITSIEGAEREARQCTVVPNPFTSSARLILDHPLLRGEHVSIMDIHGRELLRVPGTGRSNVEIERNGLSAGVYVVLVKDGTSILGSGRMVVE